MKKIFISLLLMSGSVLAQTQQNFVTVNKPVICGPLDVMLKGLADKDVDEKPVWIGKRDDQKTEFYMFINFKTSAFTVIEAGKEIGCILGIGYKSNFLAPPKDSIKFQPVLQ